MNSLFDPAPFPSTAPPTEAIMALRSSVPDSAMTAELLGTERVSHAVQINAEGLLLTAGYSVLEANEIFITNHAGLSTEGIVLAQDYNSGIALIKPMNPLGHAFVESAPLSSLKVDNEAEDLTVMTSDDVPQQVKLIALDEFAGRWEYLLEQAIYTTPLCEHWSGAALLNTAGQLVGIGALALGLSERGGSVIPGNMFIPSELVMEHLEHLSLHGETPEEKRPWLGILAEELDSELHIIGIYNNAPAAEAGVKPGDIILSVGTQPVASLSGFFRTLWHYGHAGSDIPLTIKEGDGHKEVVVSTVDRNSFFTQRENATLN